MEHVQVIDTVFVKEILGTITLDQRVSSTDTVYHIIQFQPSEQPQQPALINYPEQESKPVIDNTEIALAPDLRIRPSFLFLASLSAFPNFSGGLMAGVYDKFGGYIKAKSNFTTVDFDYDCNSEGVTNRGIIMTNGKTDLSKFNLTAGALIKTAPWLVSYLGAGYGYNDVFWQDIDSKWAKVTDASFAGLSIDAGLVLTFNYFAVSVGLNVLDFNYSEFEIGLGIRF